MGVGERDETHMRVNDNNLAGLGAPGLDRAGSTEAVERAGAGGAQAKQAGGASDQVSLSGLAARLQELDSQSPDREAKLNGLKAAYESGQYQAPAEQVAERMMDDAAAGKGTPGRTGPA